MVPEDLLSSPTSDATAGASASMAATRVQVEAMAAPKAVRKQIGESGEGLPVRRGAGESVIEAEIEDERLPRRVADGPKIADRIASKKRLREVPDFPGKNEILEERMRDGQ